MADFMQGSPLPDITKTTTRTAPEYYTDYLSAIATAGQPYLTKPATELVAGLDPLQATGYAGIEDAAGAYDTGLGEAEKAISGLTGGFDVSRISDYMDPYKKNVVEEMERQAQQQLQRSILPTLKAGFVGSGGLGGQRYAGALGQALADVQSNLTGQTYGALSSGYKDAMDAALREYGMETQAAQTQANIAKLAQDLGLTESKALREAGAEKQAYEQAKINAPLTTAQNVSNLLRGFQYPTSEKYVGPGERGMYGLSDFDKIAGLLSTVGAVTGGGGSGNKLTDISKLYNKFFGGSNTDTSWLDDLLSNTGDISGSDTSDLDALLNEFGGG
jgi:hypothetical protein